MGIFDTFFPNQTSFDPIQEYKPEVARALAENLLPYFEQYFRVEYYGLENIPERQFIGIGVHGGSLLFDALIWAGKYLTIEKTKPQLLSLAHKVLGSWANIPALKIINQIGIITANYANANLCIDQGFALQIYPGGDKEVYRPFHQRNQVNFFGRKGFVKLALARRLPILPIVSIGAHETYFLLWDGNPIAKFLGLDKLMNWNAFPLVFSLPHGFTLTPIPKPNIPFPAQITFSVLEPMLLDDYEPEDAQNDRLVTAIADEIQRRMQTELDKLAKNRIPIYGKIKM